MMNGRPKAKHLRDFEAHKQMREQEERKLEEETRLSPSRTTEGETLQDKQKTIDSTGSVNAGLTEKSANGEFLIEPLKSKDAAANTDDFTTPTWEQLSDEQRQDNEVIRRKRREEFEALKKKREEEDLQMFYEFEKDIAKARS